MVHPLKAYLGIPMTRDAFGCVVQELGSISNSSVGDIPLGITIW